MAGAFFYKTHACRLHSTEGAGRNVRFLPLVRPNNRLGLEPLIAAAINLLIDKRAGVKAGAADLVRKDYI